MLQLIVLSISIIIAYIISLISGIYKILKKNQYPFSSLCLNIIFKAFSLRFINNLLNTSTREERVNILDNLVIAEYGISFEKRIYSKIKSTDILALAATSLTIFSVSNIPKQEILINKEVQEITKISNSNATHTFKF